MASEMTKMGRGAIRPRAGMPARRSGGMNEAQRAALQVKQAEGFVLVREEDDGCLVVRKGNNWQLIQQSGRVRRALGAVR